MKNGQRKREKSHMACISLSFCTSFSSRLETRGFQAIYSSLFAPFCISPWPIAIASMSSPRKGLLVPGFGLNVCERKKERRWRCCASSCCSRITSLILLLTSILSPLSNNIFVFCFALCIILLFSVLYLLFVTHRSRFVRFVRLLPPLSLSSPWDFVNVVENICIFYMRERLSSFLYLSDDEWSLSLSLSTKRLTKRKKHNKLKNWMMNGHRRLRKN